MHHVERLSNGNCGLEEGTVYTDILNSFNRIAAHCASAMVALLKSGDENPDMHIHDSKIYPSACTATITKKTADIRFQIICCHYIIYIYCFVV